MKQHQSKPLGRDRKVLRWSYSVLLIAMGFTGLGQMPIFKRYYVADIPGLGWSANFYLTHTLHYFGAIILLGIIAYVVLDYFLIGRKTFTLTFSAYIRMIFLTGLVTSGIFRVLKNLPAIVFSPSFTMFIDIAHLAFMMSYLIFALLFLYWRVGWIKPRTSLGSSLADKPAG